MKCWREVKSGEDWKDARWTWKHAGHCRLSLQPFSWLRERWERELRKSAVNTAASYPSFGWAAGERKEMWLREQFCSVLFGFRGRKDLNLFKCHWEGNQMREKLNNVGKRKHNLFIH